jgi:hypothetical protein
MQLVNAALAATPHHSDLDEALAEVRREMEAEEQIAEIRRYERRDGA